MISSTKLTNKKYTLETWNKILKEFQTSLYLYHIAKEEAYRFEEAYIDQIILARFLK